MQLNTGCDQYSSLSIQRDHQKNFTPAICISMTFHDLSLIPGLSRSGKIVTLIPGSLQTIGRKYFPEASKRESESSFGHTVRKLAPCLKELIRVTLAFTKTKKRTTENVTVGRRSLDWIDSERGNISSRWSRHLEKDYGRAIPWIQDGKMTVTQQLIPLVFHALSCGDWYSTNSLENILLQQLTQFSFGNFQGTLLRWSS